MANPVELVRRLCFRFPPPLPPPRRSRVPRPQPRCLVRARLRLPGSPLSLRCRALDTSKSSAVKGEPSEEYDDDDEEPYFSETSSRLSEVDYLGESTKGDLNVRRRHLDALGGNGKSTLHGPIEEIAWKEARQAETLLSDLGIADPLTVRNSPRGIFCTRTLNLRSISVIGYDMDYTLIHYNVMAWEGRAYDYGMANLKSMGFLVDDLEFDPDLVIRGLIMDKVKGNLVKADRFGYIKRVMHGTQMLPTRAVSEIYGRELVDLRKEDTWEFLNTLFSVSEAVMFMQMVDKLDQGLVPAELGPLDYKGLYNAVSKALFRAHVEGQLKSEIMAEPERFVEPDPELPLALLDQKEAGKRLLLITNSDYHCRCRRCVELRRVLPSPLPPPRPPLSLSANLSSSSTRGTEGRGSDPARDGRPPRSVADADMHSSSPSSAIVAYSSSSPSDLSPADGFLCVKEGVDEMIKHVANEPSLGLYFVQQHAQASMPILLDVKGKVTEKTREITLHTEDIEDSICAVRSMAEFGLPIADDMIKDINKSLKIMSKTQPKRGLIQNPIWGFQSDKSSEPLSDLDTTNGGSSKNYLSSMLNTAKQKASSLRWPQTDSAMNDGISEKSVSSTAQESSQAGGHGASTPLDAERDEVSISNRLLENKNAATMNQGLSPSDISHMAESYNKFKEEQELKLQEWLRESKEAEDNRACHCCDSSGVSVSVGTCQK